MTRQGTARVLRAMLTENTGRSILDSGDAYGRNWQRNQGRDFDAEPATVLDARWGLSVTHNVYHWLLERVDYDRDAQNMQRRYDRWVERNSDNYTSHTEDIAGFIAYLRERGEIDDDGLYWADGGTFGENTYNGPDLLSQTLQYAVFAHAPRNAGHTALYVIVQIHGGCDVRGGYTRPRIFSIIGDDSTCLLDNARAYLSCDGYDIAAVTCGDCGAVTEADRDDSARVWHGQRIRCGACLSDNVTIERRELRHMWYTDDAYHWHSDDTDTPDMRASYRDGDRWRTADIVTVNRADIADGDIPDAATDDDGVYIGAGVYDDVAIIEYDDDGVYCPCCGTQLHAHSY